MTQPSKYRIKPRQATLARYKNGSPTIKIEFPFSPEDVALVKTLPGRKYNPDHRIWTCPPTKHAIKMLKEWAFVIDKKLLDFMRKADPPPVLEIPGLKKKLFPFQKSGVAFLQNKDGRGLIGDQMGLGKAQPWYSKVLTPSGWREIISLKPNDEIFGIDGQIHQVTGIYPQGLKDIYKVTFSDRTSAECCIDHLWQIQTPYDRYKNKSGRVLDLKTIMNDPFMLSRGNAKYFIPITKAINFPQINLPLAPYLLGALLGDGTLYGKTQFTNADVDVVQKVETLLPKNVTLKKFAKFEYRISTNSNDKWSTNPVKQIVQTLGLSVRSEYKFIPDLYKFSSIPQRIELLRGLMDTDGYTSTKSKVTQFCTVSERLADDVMYLVQTLGGIAYKSKKRTHYKHKGIKKEGKLAYNITIRLPNNINPFYCMRKHHAYVPNSKYLPARSIKHIEKVGQEFAFCISTNAPNQLYITDNCIVTHNTVQALAWLQLNKNKRPVIIVVPASVKMNWLKEIRAWMSDVSVEVLQGKSPYSFKADIIIINYDILNGWLNTLIELQPKVIIADEIQYVKNSKAKRTKALRKLSRFTKNFIALSGTPIVNRPVEFYNAIQMINPELFPNWQNYVRRYCAARNNGFGLDVSGASNTDELHEILTDSIMIRRTKQEVLTDLPDKIHSFFPLEMHPEMVIEYEEAEDNFIEWVQRKKGKAAADRVAGAEALTEIEILKQIAVTAKLPAAIDWIKDFLDTGEKLVVFATHRFVIDRLMKDFGRIAVKIDGSVSGGERQVAVEKFQNEPETRLFVGNIKAAGVGITLTAASNVAFLELPWEPGSLSQAEDRCHRIGQKDTVNVYYLLAEYTIEEKIAQLLDSKRKVLDSVLDGVESADEGMIMTLIEDYEEA